MILIKEASKSFWLLYKNPILFVPDLIFIFLTWLAFQILLPFSGIKTLIESGENILTNDVLSIFYQNYFMHFLITLIIFSFVTFIVGVIYQVIKYNMIKEVIKNKPANLFLSWQKRKQYFWRVVSLKIYVFIISVLVSLLLGVVATIIYVLVSLFTANPLGIASYISIIISLLVIILVKIAILFRYPALFLNIQKPVNALKDSINIFLKKPRFAVKVWLLIVGVTLLFTFISIVFHALDSTVQLWLNSFTQFFSIIFATVFILVELVPFIWSDIFLFSLYSKLKNQ